MLVIKQVFFMEKVIWKRTSEHKDVDIPEWRNPLPCPLTVCPSAAMRERKEKEQQYEVRSKEYLGFFPE